MISFFWFLFLKWRINRGDVWVKIGSVSSFWPLFFFITNISRGWICCVNAPLVSPASRRKQRCFDHSLCLDSSVLQRCIGHKPSTRTPSFLRCSSSSLSTFTPLHFMWLSSKEGVTWTMQNTHTHTSPQTHAHTLRHTHSNPLCRQVCGLPNQLWHPVWDEERRRESLIYLETTDSYNILPPRNIHAPSHYSVVLEAASLNSPSNSSSSWWENSSSITSRSLLSRTFPFISFFFLTIGKLGKGDRFIYLEHSTLCRVSLHISTFISQIFLQFA